jgi:hypothetical protein
LAHQSEKKKLWRLPKVEGSILKYRVPPLWPTFIGERRTTCAYGIKVTGKKSEVLLRTLWGNMMESGRSTVQVENEQRTVQSPHQTELGKKNLTPPHLQEKREDPSVHGATSYWLHENSIPKIG